jgi:hypothetical protein
MQGPRPPTFKSRLGEQLKRCGELLLDLDIPLLCFELFLQPVEAVENHWLEVGLQRIEGSDGPRAEALQRNLRQSLNATRVRSQNVGRDLSAGQRHSFLAVNYYERRGVKSNSIDPSRIDGASGAIQLLAVATRELGQVIEWTGSVKLHEVYETDANDFVLEQLVEQSRGLHTVDRAPSGDTDVRADVGRGLLVQFPHWPQKNVRTRKP